MASGADITIAMIDVYNNAHIKPDSTNRGSLLAGIFQLMKPG